MKNLKTYKIFESIDISQNIIDEIMDMGKDLIDDGFHIDFINKNISSTSLQIYMMSGDNHLKFEFSQIKEFVITIQSYLELEGYNSQICLWSTGRFHSFKLSDIGPYSKIKSSVFGIYITEK